jgi:hypothetical protein
VIELGSELLPQGEGGALRVNNIEIRLICVGIRHNKIHGKLLNKMGLGKWSQEEE